MCDSRLLTCGGSVIVFFFGGGGTADCLPVVGVLLSGVCV